MPRIYVNQGFSTSGLLTFGVTLSFVVGLACAMCDVQQHPWLAPEIPVVPPVWLQKMSPDIARYILGGKIGPICELLV